MFAFLERLGAPEVDADVAEFVGFRKLGSAPRPAQHGLDACEQLQETERFGDVVVGTALEAGHLVRLLSAGGQHDDRDAVVVLPDPLAHVDAAELGQHHVEDHHVGVPLRRQT